MDSPTSNSVASDEKQRDRSRRSERGTRFSDNKDNEPRDRSRDRMGGGVNRRVYVSNIPYEYRWQDLKASINSNAHIFVTHTHTRCVARATEQTTFRLRLFALQLLCSCRFHCDSISKSNLIVHNSLYLFTCNQLRICFVGRSVMLSTLNCSPMKMESHAGPASLSSKIQTTLVKPLR